MSHFVKCKNPNCDSSQIFGENLLALKNAEISVLKARIVELGSGNDGSYLVAKQRLSVVESKLALAIEALEYYAHPDHYETRYTISPSDGPQREGVLNEGGDKAREVLKKLRTNE